MDDPSFRVSKVGVPGEPVRVRCRLELVPVGQDWDETFMPIDRLTYPDAKRLANPPEGTDCVG